jgi:hypothetical protein
MSAYDPTATLAVHCVNGFDAGFGRKADITSLIPGFP